MLYQRKPCSRRKALRNDAKMYPNGSQNGSKHGPKMGSEIALKWLLIFGCFFGPNWVPKWAQNGSKLGPKNGWQNELRFLMKKATPTSTLAGRAGPVGEDLGRGKGFIFMSFILGPPSSSPLSFQRIYTLLGTRPILLRCFNDFFRNH